MSEAKKKENDGEKKVFFTLVAMTTDGIMLVGKQAIESFKSLGYEISDFVYTNFEDLQYSVGVRITDGTNEKWIVAKAFQVKGFDCVRIRDSISSVGKYKNLDEALIALKKKDK